MVERGERVRLTAAELGDERHHRRGVRCLAGEPPQHHPRVLPQRPGEAGAGEELLRLPVVLGCGLADDLFQMDGELVRVEGAAFADFLARRGDLVPVFPYFSPDCNAPAGSRPRTVSRRSRAMFTAATDSCMSMGSQSPG